MMPTSLADRLARWGRDVDYIEVMRDQGGETLPLPCFIILRKKEIYVMWIRILKGALLGVVVFVSCNFVYLYLMVRASEARGARAIGTKAIRAWTVQNPLYWLAFLAVLALAYLFVELRKKDS
jgi:hypothetical protein